MHEAQYTVTVDGNVTLTTASREEADVAYDNVINSGGFTKEATLAKTTVLAKAAIGVVQETKRRKPRTPSTKPKKERASKSKTIEAKL